MTWKKENEIQKKNDQQRGALRIEIREMDEHSAVRGHLYYLLTLKIITCSLARAEMASNWLIYQNITLLFINYGL